MLRTSLLLVGTVAAACGALVAIVYGGADGALTFVLLAGLGASALACAHLLERRRLRLGSLRRQFAAAAAIGAAHTVVAALAAAQVMFVSRHDALFVVMIALLSGIVATCAAALFTRGVLHDIDVLGRTLHAVRSGSREPAQIGAARDELSDLAAAANATILELDRSDTARRNLVAAVSHDLRTPITSLQLLVDAVGDDIVDDETRRRYLGQMDAHVKALSHLIDDLFELSRLEAGEITWSMSQVRVGDLVADTVEAMRPHADAKRVSVRTWLPSDLAPAQAHPEKLQRVLFNLIQNAIRHTPADGSVTVLAEPAADGIEIEVADTGDGIASGDRQHVFEPFFRGGTEAARTRTGAGLGLAISRAIVEAHGGRIWLVDGDSAGARVRFSLPS